MSMSSGKNLPHALPPENAAKVYMIITYNSSTYKYMLNDCRHRLQYVMSLSIILCSRSSLLAGAEWMQGVKLATEFLGWRTPKTSKMMLQHHAQIMPVKGGTKVEVCNQPLSQPFSSGVPARSQPSSPVGNGHEANTLLTECQLT